MYDVNRTIVAVSSPTSSGRVIVRITGPETMAICQHIFRSSLPIPKDRGTTVTGRVSIDAELSVDAQLYLFRGPHSYTGDCVAEIHLHTNRSVTEALISNLLSRGLEMAGPGEFTARAYLNGKIDLAQAEAVNEIVVSSNALQLAAAEALLSGRLGETTAEVCSAMMDCLSLIEAGLDFSGEDIELTARPEATDRLVEIRGVLEQLLSDSIRYESVIDLPAVGIAGAPNAGKSSLLNKLLGRDRSIISAERKTTRDVLTGLLTLIHCRCVLFDCAGLTREPRDILDELAYEAAIEALRNSSIIVFCVDVSKADWSEDFSVYELVAPKTLIPVATKSDLLSEDALVGRLAVLNDRFAGDFLATSVVTCAGLEQLRGAIDRNLLELSLGSGAAEPAALPFVETATNPVVLTARHRGVIAEAVESISESINELGVGNDEVAAMMLRAAYQGISGIESADRRIDEQILEQIFSRFCIGK